MVEGYTDKDLVIADEIFNVSLVLLYENHAQALSQ